MLYNVENFCADCVKEFAVLSSGIKTNSRDGNLICKENAIFQVKKEEPSLVKLETNKNIF